MRTMQELLEEAKAELNRRREELVIKRLMVALDALAEKQRKEHGAKQDGEKALGELERLMNIESDVLADDLYRQAIDAASAGFFPKWMKQVVADDRGYK